MKLIYAGVLVLSLLALSLIWGCSGGEKQAKKQEKSQSPEHLPLSQRLATLRENLTGGMPPEIIAIGQRHRAELLASGILDKALNVGDKAPSFKLQDALGKTVSSADLLAKGPIVVAFYRGGW
ncbi:MAG: hypothetical protein D6800_13250 [Candidatus Zixiibacteriota bacterium]|nr:MAG: hypothetical protein D6800_13250 [candidate division Zixibacteria bacterium]